MAEIPLHDYIALIEGQINAGAADEASYHSRHILGRYPRCVAAFRLLGRALLLKGQYDEAEAAFRRVLGAYPTDLIAHLGLADLYDRRRRGDEAIWHAERALEVEVNRDATTSLLAALYRTYRNEGPPRHGLTALTLARQAMQKHNYDQAIATLRDSLERQPDRVDQRLLLAEALWTSGDHVGGAEIATDVLDSLPDCITANTLLAQLWLEVGRPSDARPYLNRLESLEPYLAVEVITGRSVEPGAFTIEPLNYQHTAQSDVARIEPDWVKGIPAGEVSPVSGQTSPDWKSGMLNMGSAEPSLEGPPMLPDAAGSAEESPTQVVPQAVGPSAAVLAAALVADEDSPGDPDLDTLLNMPTTLLGEPRLDEVENYSVTAMFDTPAEEVNLFDESATNAVTPGLNDFVPYTPDSFSAASVPPFAEDAAGYSPVPAIGATSPLPPLRDSFTPDPLAHGEDAMAWLRESGVELIEDEAPDFSLETGTEFPAGASTDDLDPMAWLNAYDSVTEAESAPEQAAVPVLGEDWQGEEWDPNAVDINAFAGETPTLLGEDLAPVPTTSLRGLTSRLGDPSAAPLSEQPPILSSEELDGWMAEFSAPATNLEHDEASPGWLNEIGVAMTNDPERTPAAADDHSPEEEAADWLTEFSPGNLRADLDAVVGETGSEWLAEATAAPETGADAGDAGLPDWLVNAAPEAAGMVAAGMSGSNQPDAAAIPSDDELDWLASLNEPAIQEASAAPELDEAVLAAQADVPDWLDALESQALAQIDANQSEFTGEDALVAEAAATSDSYEPLPFDETPVAAVEEAETDWLAAGPAVAGVAGIALAAAAVNEWGEEASASGEEASLVVEGWDEEVPVSVEELPAAFEVAEPAAEYEAVMLDDGMTGDEELAAAVVIEAEPQPEWLAGVSTENEEQPVVAALGEEISEPETPDWGEPEQAELSRIAPPTVGIADLPPEVELPTAPDDWFVDGALAAEAPVPDDGSLVSAGSGDWFVDEALLAPAEAEAAEWQPGPEETAAELPAVETVVALAEPELLDETAEPVSEEAGFGAEEGALVAGAAALGVLAVASGEETETAPGDAVLDELDEEWLSAEWPDDAEAPVLAADELDELPDVEIAEETIIAPATNAPDWLNAMVPGLDMDFESAEDEPVEAEFGAAFDETLGARSEYAWVIDLVEQEEMETAPAEMVSEAEFEQPRFVFRSLPAWYRQANGSSGDDDDFADWPSDDPSQPAYQN
ncbi:MAG: tetratricopeptide repeat protein [Anaerolineae bacterium]|nr:tetratricopeptide repeat protein [Anaerolineae bacterium]